MLQVPGLYHSTNATSVRNRLWIARYAKAITVVGILMLIGGVAGGVSIAYQLPSQEWLLAYMSGSAAVISLSGFLALGLANLLTYLLGVRQQPGWILEHAEMGLYLLAVCRLMNQVSLSCYQATAVPIASWYAWLGFSGIMTVTGALMMVALGLVLRRAIPIIEESRTLV